MNVLRLTTSLLMVSAIVGCNSTMNQDSDSASQTIENDVGGAETAETKRMQITDRDSKVSVEIDGTEQVSGFLRAWQKRERTYEKVMPLFEYAVTFEFDGNEQHWRVNKAGYCMQEGSSELYKMNTEALHGYMN